MVWPTVNRHHTIGKTIEELLVVTHSLDENSKMKHDYHLSNAHPDTPLEELARDITHWFHQGLSNENKIGQHNYSRELEHPF